MGYLSVVLFSALVYLEVCPEYNTDTYWRKIAIFALLVLIVAKG